MVTIAGLAALQGATGVIVASVLLTGAVIVGLVGVAYAGDRRVGVGILALIAAAFPLFLGLYAIGHSILTAMGAGVAGGLLIGLGAGFSLTAIGFWAAGRRGSVATK